MGERALDAPVCAEIGMGVAGSLALFADRISEFMTYLTLALFSVRDHKGLVSIESRNFSLAASKTSMRKFVDVQD